MIAPPDRPRAWLPRNIGWLSLVLLPVVMIWPVAFGLSQDPMGLGIGLLTGGRPGWLPGTTNLDLNIGATTQALGHLAAEQWLRFEVPWWNPYNGIGMPLAGEMSPSALFMPFVLLLHFQNGPLLIKMALQMVAGPATYALLRRLGLGVSLSWLGGLMFALSGTYAWLGHAPMMPIAFLPLFLLGIENARAGGFRLIALALALSLTAGFPEMAYVNGLLALAWAMWRWRQSETKARFTRCIALGGGLGLVLAAPAIWSFLHFLLHGSVQNHAVIPFGPPGDPVPAPIYAVWLFPYLLGPLQAFTSADRLGEVAEVLPNLGGYLGLAPLLLVLLSLTGPRLRGLRILLAVWIALCVMKTASVPGVLHALNLIPLIRETIFSRYSLASWHFAAVLLGVLTLSDWQAGGLSRRLIGTATTACLILASVALFLAYPLLSRMSATTPHFSAWPLLSVLWGMTTTAVVVWLLTRKAGPSHMAAMLGLLAVNAAALFCLPMLSGPRDVTIDKPAIAFLQDRIGLQRFFTLGPYLPNYGAYFETAQITHEYLPQPALWEAHIQRALDPSADPIMFRGNYPPTLPGQPTHAAAFVDHLDNFKALGVRYVLTEPGQNPFITTFESLPQRPHAAARNLGPGPGQSMSGKLDPAQMPQGMFGRTLGQVGVEIGTYMGQSDGALAVELCTDTTCAQGRVELAGAADNAVITITLPYPLAIVSRATLTWTLQHEGGTQGVAIWLPESGAAAPRLIFGLHTPHAPPPRIYRDAVMDIYELADAAPYFEAPDGGCQLYPADRRTLRAVCDRPGTLIRRELFFPGWRARVDNIPADIAPYQGIMQQIALPRGETTITFNYAPPLSRSLWLLAAFAALATVPWRRLRTFFF